MTTRKRRSLMYWPAIATGVMKCLNIISKRRRRVLHSGAKLSVRPMIGVILNACRMSVGPMHGSMVVKHATP